MVRTESQLFAQRAFEKVSEKQGKEKESKYRTLALSFPSLVHSCGLAQAIAFVEVKERDVNFHDDLKYVLGLEQGESLSEKSRRTELLDYMQLSRRVMVASGWLKRYAEALLKKE
jgi:CRISPR-associated protein Cmr5